MSATAPRMLSETERRALAGLVAEHQSRMRAFLCRFERDAAVLDELLQDVFINVLPRCEELVARPADEAAKYLRGVARNLVRQRWRKLRQQRGRAPLEDLLLDRLEAPLEQEPDDSPVRLSALRQCFEGLGAKAQEMVTRHFFQDVPIVALARELGQTDAALRMVLFRIRRQLRACMEARLG